MSRITLTVLYTIPREDMTSVPYYFPFILITYIQNEMIKDELINKPQQEPIA